MIRTILIDDENNALEVLEILLKKYCPNVEILEKCNGGKAGIDAIDKNGLKVQIKTRRESQDEAKGNHVRIGRFSQHYFDYALLGILDKQYRLREVWKAAYADLMPIIDNDKKRNPNMSSFKRVANRIL